MYTICGKNTTAVSSFFYAESIIVWNLPDENVRFLFLGVKETELTNSWWQKSYGVVRVQFVD